MKWQIRFLKNALIGVLPLGLQRLARRVKRHFFPHRLVLDLWTLEQGLRQVQMLRNAGTGPGGKHVLEVGTGWAPVIPLIFHFAGAKSLTLVDRQRLMDDSTFRETCRQMMEHAETIAGRLGKDSGRVRATLARLSELSLEEGFAHIGCSYLAPFDLMDRELAARRFDIVISRAVLEHIPRTVLAGIFARAWQLLGDGGVMCHLIDNSDHWEHNDKQISRVNFLKYGPRLFGLLSSLNPLDYQNRLRHSEYLDMMRAAGFEVVHDESVPDARALGDLGGLRLAPCFRSFAKEDLAILSSNVVVRKIHKSSRGAKDAGTRLVGDAL